MERHSEAVEVWSSLEHPSIAARRCSSKKLRIEASGQRVEAIEALHQALKHHPNPSLVQGMLKDLKTRTEMSEGGRAVHGSRAPARRQQAKITSATATIDVVEKTVKAPRQVQGSTTKPRGKTAAMKKTKKAAAPQKAAPPQEPTKAAIKEETKVTPTKAATTPTPAPKASPAKPSPTPDPKASDTP